MAGLTSGTPFGIEGGNGHDLGVLRIPQRARNSGRLCCRVECPKGSGRGWGGTEWVPDVSAVEDPDRARSKPTQDPIPGEGGVHNPGGAWVHTNPDHGLVVA